jgi:hypothetical protein
MRLIIGILTVLVMISCKKKEIENPYDLLPPPPSNQNPDLVQIPQSNFAYLHAKIFKPTCANSGCHDGTFEPEFRSISGSYNTLVNHPGISNDFSGSFPLRVVPGNSSASLLYARMTIDLPNSSGIMPLVTNPGSDWPANAAQYINMVKEWIDGGAKDMFGNEPGSANADLPPQVDGFAVFPPGNTTEPFPRGSGIGIQPILVSSAQVDVWIRVTDDNTPPQSVTGQLKHALSVSALEAANGVAFQTNATISALDFSDNPTDFRHKATIDLTGIPAGSAVYLRCVLNDGVQPQPTEIPNPGSSDVIQAIFILKIQ